MKHINVISQPLAQPALAASSLAVKEAYLALWSDWLAFLTDLREFLGIGGE